MDLVEILKTEPVKLAAELKTGSRLPTGEYTPPYTQLNSTQHVQFSIFLLNLSAVVVNYCEFNIKSIQTARRQCDSTQQSSRVGVGRVSLNIIPVKTRAVFEGNAVN